MARVRSFVVLFAGALVLLAAAPAMAALPRTYQVQRVDSPTPVAGGDFGIGFVNTGDVNGDGEDDMLVGTDEHGGSTGPVYVISGADGSRIRSFSAPDASAAGAAAGFGSYVGKLADIASCPGGTPGVTCPNDPTGGPDGVPDMLISALGVDVGGLTDAGRGYVIDGATGAVLKRLDMPTTDINEQLAITLAGGAHPAPALGRTILNPSSPYGPTKPDLSGPADAAAAVQIGDLNGGGKPDIIVSASDFYETGATANPESPCAAAGPTAQCLQAGRSYVYYGETIAPGAGGIAAPGTPDNAPDLSIKNLAAQPDDPDDPVNGNRENLGYSIEPVGDLGRCVNPPGAGLACTAPNSTTTPDGKPDVVISSHRSDDFGMFDAGVALLIDGSSGSVLYTYHHPEPQPASLFAFSNYNQPAVGDLGSSTAPDVYQAAMRQNNPFTGGGKAYVMNGAFKQAGSPNSISFATLTDPTPTASEDFGTSSAGIGNVFGDGRNEVLVGAYGPHNPGTNAGAINDVHIFSALDERELQRFAAPDQQPGLGFGTALAPMGDLNNDGFLDFAVGAGLYDGLAGPDQGRIYVFRSDNSPAPAAPSPPAPPPTGTGGAVAATALSGRALELVASSARLRVGHRLTLRGELDAFANPSGCQAGQEVQLQRRTARSVKYRTFQRVRTRSDGVFSARSAPRRTYFYRALVPQTGACLGAVSGREKVTVTAARKARRSARSRR